MTIRSTYTTQKDLSRDLIFSKKKKKIKDLEPSVMEKDLELSSLVSKKRPRVIKPSVIKKDLELSRLVS